MKNKYYRQSFRLQSLIVLLLIGFLSSCQKNVETLILFTDISVGGVVYNAATLEPIFDAEIVVNGTSITRSSSDGQYTLNDLKEGTYNIKVTKSGFSVGYHTLYVNNFQGFLPAIYLRPLAPPVTIGKEGGLVTAYYSTGKKAADLNIPPSSYEDDKEISATVLFGNEVPAIITGDNEIQGTTVSFDSNEEINFANGALLTFTLPYRHRPGDLIEVTLFNDESMEWETFEYIPVNEDGLSASVTIHHFSIYSITLQGSCITISSNPVNYEIVGTSDNYQDQYSWNSYLNYTSNIPGEDETSVREIKIFLNQTLESYSGLKFSEIAYYNNQLPVESLDQMMYFSPSAPPVGNPIEYADLTKNKWELIKHCCIVKVKTTLKIYNLELDDYEDVVVNSNYLKCYFDWLWRANSNYALDNYIFCGNGRIIIPASEDTHSGGSAE